VDRTGPVADEQALSTDDWSRIHVFVLPAVRRELPNDCAVDQPQGVEGSRHLREDQLSRHEDAGSPQPIERNTPDLSAVSNVEKVDDARRERTDEQSLPYSGRIGAGVAWGHAAN
jgi:hypothetical protein